MVINPDDLNFNVPSITGGQGSNDFTPWQPSTWPLPPKQFGEGFQKTLGRIFKETILDELRNVVADIKTANPAKHYPMEHRGHVIAVAYMCALDAIASYGYKGKHVQAFVRAHFPDQYKPFASRIYPEYRLSLVHDWNLFGSAALLPGDDAIKEENGQIRFGILHFVGAFEKAVADFLDKLGKDKQLQQRALSRYRQVTK